MSLTSDTLPLRRISVGCRHCVSCHARQGTPRTPGHTQSQMDMWPAGLQTPTVYYMCRERQLAYQIHLMAGRSDEWRQPLAGQQLTAPLLRRRARHALAIYVPLMATGVDTTDSAVIYTGTVAVACTRPAPAKPSPAASAPAHAPAASRPAAVQAPQRLATPPTTHEQPAKRHCGQISCVSQAAVHVAAPSAAQALYTPDCVVVVGFAPSHHPTPSHSWEPCSLALSQPASSRFDSSAAQKPAHLAASCAAECNGQGSLHSSPMSSWLEKIRSMLSPASRFDSALVC